MCQAGGSVMAVTGTYTVSMVLQSATQPVPPVSRGPGSHPPRPPGAGGAGPPRGTPPGPGVVPVAGGQPAGLDVPGGGIRRGGDGDIQGVHGFAVRAAAGTAGVAGAGQPPAAAAGVRRG